MLVSAILTSTRAFVRSSAFLASALALAAALPMSSSAATPIAVWDGDFSDSALTKGAWTLNRGWNATNATASAITIDRDNAGINLDTSSPLSNGVTVIVRFSGLMSGSNERVLATSCVEPSHSYDRTGIRLLADGKLRGCGNNSQNSGTLSNYGTAANSSLLSGYMAFSYRGKTSGASNVGTFIYFRSADGTYPAASNWGTVNLTYGSDTEIYGVTIGGLRQAVSGWEAAKGMTVDAIAVFDGALSVDEMNAFSFGPSAYSVTANTTVSAINAAMNGAGEVNLTVSPNVEITLDEEFDASIVRFASSGTVTLKSLVPPSPAELSKFYASDVQGAFIRTWLNPGVVGFNFTQNNGVNTSSALAEGEWFGDVGVANGSMNPLFFDGVSKITWTASNTYNTLDNTQTFLSGYLDDGNGGCNITISAIPYATYDVIIYSASDTATCKFSPKTVNGTTYTCGSDGIAVEGNTGWGGSGNNTAAVYGRNAMRVNGLSGVLTINGGEKKTYDNYCRGGISAIQIMPTGATSGESEAVFDATAEMEITDAAMKTRIRSSYRNVRILGDGSNGVLLDYGSSSEAFSSHIVFDGGKHTLKYSGKGSVVKLGNREGAPIFESANGATVDFYQHDLTGYSGAQIVATTDIRVDSGTTMNLIPYGNGTTYYRGRYTIEPGAVLTSYFSEEVNGGSTFRMHGGAVEGYEQIYVPVSDSIAHAVINGDATSNGKLHIHNDSTVGFGIFVGENSTLDFDLAITSYDSNAPIGKWGGGVVNFNSDLSGYKGTLTVHEGTVCVTSATTIASIVNEKNATLAYSVAARPTLTSYSGDGNVVVDISSLVDGGAIASGSYVLAPSSVPSYRVSAVGLPENSGFSIAETADGIVLTDEDVFSPVWTGASGAWTSSVFDGRSGNADGMNVAFYQGATPQAFVAVAVDGDKSPASITFGADDTAYMLYGDQITTTDGITAYGVAPVVISNKLVVGGSVVLNAGTELTLATNEVSLASGALSGSGTLVLDPGEGNEFTMSTANTSYTGEAVIASGTVKMGNVTSFGAIGRTSVIRVKNNATLLVHPDCANDDEGERNSLVLEYGAKYTSTGYLDYGAYPMTKLTLEGDASIAAEQANVAVAKKYFDPIEIALGEHTLTKTGMNTLCIAAATINGAGKIDVEEGYLRLYNGYWYGPNNVCKFLEGTLRIGVGAQLQLCRYAAIGTQKDAWDANENKYSLLTVNRLELDGIVTRDDDSVTTITVNGLVTGCGTTPVLILGKNAVFKPTGTGYLTITESLTLPTNTVGEEEDAEEVPYMVIDLTDALASNTTVIPLFKVGSAENLPDAENIRFICYPGQDEPSQALPRGWKLSTIYGGCGYKLSKGTFSILLR